MKSFAFYATEKHVHDGDFEPLKLLVVRHHRLWKNQWTLNELTNYVPLGTDGHIKEHQGSGSYTHYKTFRMQCKSGKKTRETMHHHLAYHTLRLCEIDKIKSSMYASASQYWTLGDAVANRVIS